MKPTSFKETNHVYSKPSDMTEDQCDQLPVFVGQDANGFPAIVSCWKLSDEEVEEIIRTKKVWLTIVSNGMPPVSLNASSPVTK